MADSQTKRGSKPKDTKSVTRIVYMVETIKESVMINLFPEKELDFSGLADGCIGVSLWFDKYTDAVKYAAGAKISQAEVIDLKLKGSDAKIKGNSKSPKNQEGV